MRSSTHVTGVLCYQSDSVLVSGGVGIFLVDRRTDDRSAGMGTG
jgi:hypothetical protein